MVCSRCCFGQHPAVKCPVDQTPLNEVERSGFKLVDCPGCPGLWLTRDTLKQAFASAEQPEQLDQAEMQPPMLKPGPARERACPGCQCQLAARVVHGIEIDVCQKCHGIWLDAGELRLIVRNHHERTIAQPGTGTSPMANAVPSSQSSKWYDGIGVPIDLDFLAPLGSVLGDLATSGVDVAKPVFEFLGEALSSLDW